MCIRDSLLGLASGEDQVIARTREADVEPVSYTHLDVYKRQELFPSTWSADRAGNSFVQFFQIDKATGDQKGIVAIDLQGWQP